MATATKKAKSAKLKRLVAKHKASKPAKKAAAKKAAPKSKAVAKTSNGLLPIPKNLASVQFTIRQGANGPYLHFQILEKGAQVSSRVRADIMGTFTPAVAAKYDSPVALVQRFMTPENQVKSLVSSKTYYKLPGLTKELQAALKAAPKR